jgi:hypothetical protein
MQDRALPHFALPVRAWFDNHFTGGWTGRRGQTECLREAPMLLLLIYFCGVGQKWESTNENKSTWWSGTTNLRFFCSYSRFVMEKCCVHVFQAEEVCVKCRSLYWNLSLYGSVWVSKCWKNCSNITFSLRDSHIAFVCTFQSRYVYICVYVWSNLVLFIFKISMTCLFIVINNL